MWPHPAAIGVEGGQKISVHKHRWFFGRDLMLVNLKNNTPQLKETYFNDFTEGMKNLRIIKIHISTATGFMQPNIKCYDTSKKRLSPVFYAFLLLWIFYVFSVLCLFVPCDHLLGKSWPLGSRLWCLTVSLSLSHWYPGSGVVLDCIATWSLHPYFAIVYVPESQKTLVPLLLEPP